jgi:hypothetical protein
VGEQASKIVEYARARLRQRVGDGECFALADLALKAAGAKSAADFGTITSDADYEWGSEVDWRVAQPGDIIQFRNHEVTIEVETETVETASDGSERIATDATTKSFARPHHTAIVKSVFGAGKVTVLEQNTQPHGRVVQENTLYLDGSVTRSPETRTTRRTAAGAVRVVVRKKTSISVSGTATIYRPEAKK